MDNGLKCVATFRRHDPVYTQYGDISLVVCNHSQAVHTPS